MRGGYQSEAPCEGRVNWDLGWSFLRASLDIVKISLS